MYGCSSFALIQLQMKLYSNSSNNIVGMTILMRTRFEEIIHFILEQYLVIPLLLAPFPKKELLLYFLSNIYICKWHYRWSKSWSKRKLVIRIKSLLRVADYFVYYEFDFKENYALYRTRSLWMDWEGMIHCWSKVPSHFNILFPFIGCVRCHQVDEQWSGWCGIGAFGKL